MKESHMRTKLAHTGDLELAKKIQSSVSVPKVLPIYMSSVFTVSYTHLTLPTILRV